MKKMYVIFSVLVLVCSCSAGEESNTDANAAVETTASIEAVVAEPEEDGWYHDNFEAASAKAEETGQLLLIDMYADWCGPCRYLSEECFPSPELQPVLSNFVLLKLDVDLAQNDIYSEKYNVSSIPCVIIAHPDGTEIGRVIGSRSTNEEYIAELETILAQ